MRIQYHYSCCIHWHHRRAIKMPMRLIMFMQYPLDFECQPVRGILLYCVFDVGL